MATSYKMSRGTGHCAATQRPFEPGDLQITALFDDPESADVLVRRDYHIDGWESAKAGAAALGLVAFWKHEARVHDDDGSAITPGDLMEMFDQIPDDRPESAGLRYVLALLLLRKRQLQSWDGGRRAPSSRTLQLCTRAAPDDVIEVIEPELSAEELERLGATLAEMLDV